MLVNNIENIDNHNVCLMLIYKRWFIVGVAYLNVLAVQKDCRYVFLI